MTTTPNPTADLLAPKLRKAQAERDAWDLAFAEVAG